MKIDFSQKLTGFDGKIITDPDGELTLSRAAIGALMNENQEKTTGEERFKRFILAERIHNAKDSLDIDDADIELIRTRIGILYLPSIVGPAWRLLDAVKKEKE